MAEIQVRLSVKFILNSDGTRPAAMAAEGGNEIGTQATFDSAITLGNQILAATGRAFKLTVVEYLDIQPAAPDGEAADYWFNLPARSDRQTIETAATANGAAMATWRWNANAINIFVNNSRSGQCSLVGQGGSIALGDPIFGLATVLHEVGHAFDLRHTHAGDSNCSGGINPVADGDGLSETIPDDNCSNRDQLSQATYGMNYAALTAAEQNFVDSSWLNVMSYHNEAVLLPAQMDVWTLNANRSRLGFCSGQTWFVANEGSDGDSGDNAAAPFETLLKGLSSVGSGDDVVLLRAGTYNSPAGGVIDTPCTLSATRGAISIRKP